MAIKIGEDAESEEDEDTQMLMVKQMNDHRISDLPEGWFDL